jgi:hypothetical protein
MKRFLLWYAVILAPGAITAFAAVPGAAADWTELADRQLWGVLISILASSLAALGVLAALMARLMNRLDKAAEQGERRQDEVLKLARDMVASAAETSKALTTLSDTTEHVARVIEQCPKREP